MCIRDRPKVAPLAAVEVVNPKMPVTVDAAELTKMCEEGQIPGCIVDGPLSLDPVSYTHLDVYKRQGMRR